MRTLATIASICLLSMIGTACTTVQAPWNGYHERYTVTYEVSDSNGKPTPMVKQDTCPKIDLPALESIPKPPYITHTCEKDRKCVEDALLQHIEALTVTINKYQKGLGETKRNFEAR